MQRESKDRKLGKETTRVYERTRWTGQSADPKREIRNRLLIIMEFFAFCRCKFESIIVDGSLQFENRLELLKYELHYLYNSNYDIVSFDYSSVY